MHQSCAGPLPTISGAIARHKFRLRLVPLTLMLALALAAALPATASAHGPLNPVASDFLARITGVPPGIQAKVVDGDLRMWMRVPAGSTVLVLDPRGAPYLRFSPQGISVNENSEMFYLNQVPVPVPPPPGLSRTTPPHWHRVAGGGTYEWHEGRLHALAVTALTPGAAYVGAWRIALVLDGRATAISGSLWHRGAPSVAWFWPILVTFLCAWAAWRVRDPAIDRRGTESLAVVALAGIAVTEFGRDLHGRPGLSVLALIELAAALVIVGWGLRTVWARRLGAIGAFAIAFIAIYEGIVMLPALTHGYVLTALPAFVARTAAVVCLGAGSALLLLGMRLASGTTDEDELPEDAEDELAPERIAPATGG